MKEIQLEVTIGNCSVQEFYEAIYKSPEVMLDYHERVNKSNAVNIGEWDDGSRVMTYDLQVALPNFVKNIIGAGPIAVREEQVIRWCGAEHFQVTSQPELQVAGASKFTTSGAVTVTSDGLDCKVSLVAQCCCSLSWPLQTTIESIMANEATVSMERFLGFCEDQLKEGGPRARPPEGVSDEEAIKEEEEGAAVVIEAEGLHEGGPCGSQEDLDQFFDAAEANSVTGMSVQLEGSGAAVPCYPPGTMLYYLQQLHKMAQENQQTLSALQKTLASIDGHVKALALQPPPAPAPCVPRVGAWPLLLAGVATATVGGVWWWRLKRS